MILETSPDVVQVVPFPRCQLSRPKFIKASCLVHVSIFPLLLLTSLEYKYFAALSVKDDSSSEKDRIHAWRGNSGMCPVICFVFSSYRFISLRPDRSSPKGWSRHPVSGEWLEGRHHCRVMSRGRCLTTSTIMFHYRLNSYNVAPKPCSKCSQDSSTLRVKKRESEETWRRKMMIKKENVK